jgi:hypothetical protein
MITSEQQHRHGGWTGDWAKISYNDLKDLPTIATWTQYAHWTIEISSWAWTHAVSWLVFQPKFITFHTMANADSWNNCSWSHSDWSYDATANTNYAVGLLFLLNYDVPNAFPYSVIATEKCYTVWVNVWSSLYANGSVSAIATDWFTITKNSSTLACKMIWQAWW